MTNSGDRGLTRIPLARVRTCVRVCVTLSCSRLLLVLTAHWAAGVQWQDGIFRQKLLLLRLGGGRGRGGWGGAGIRLWRCCTGTRLSEKENKDCSEMCTALQLTAYEIQPSVCTIGAVRDGIEEAKWRRTADTEQVSIWNNDVVNFFWW